MARPIESSRWLWLRPDVHRRNRLYNRLRARKVPRRLAGFLAHKRYPYSKKAIRYNKWRGEVVIDRFTNDFKIIATISLNVKISRWLKVRVWLATRILALGAWVAGCGFEVETEEGDEDANRMGSSQV